MFNSNTGISGGDPSKTAMSEEHQQILCKNIEHVAERLCSTDKVLNRFVARKVITPPERDMLLNFSGTYKQNTELVMLLLKKTEEAFDVFTPQRGICLT